MRSYLLKCVVSFILYVFCFQPVFLRAGDSVVNVDQGDIVWSQTDGARNQIYFTTFLSEKNIWSTPVKVTDDEYRNGHPTIDAGTDGSKLLAWVAGSGANYKIHYSIGTEGAWSKSAVIPSSLKVNLAPSVMIDGSGVKWIAWSGNDGGQDEIYYSRFIGNNWTAPALVNAPNEVPDILPEIALNDNNIPQVTWVGHRKGVYVKLMSTWGGESWSAESEGQASSQEKNTHENASIGNMPAFIDQPDKAFVRIYKFSPVK
jgi:hypothetical protein